jgi:pilus assembly protein Flp/PilA
MSTIYTAIRQFARDERGVTTIEYGLIAAVMVTAVAAAFGGLSTALENAFTAISGKIKVT